MNAKTLSLTAVSVLLAAGGVVAAGFLMREPGQKNQVPAQPKAESAPQQPTDLKAEPTTSQPMAVDAEIPPEAFEKMAPGTTKYFKMPWTKSGINCGYGLFLPLLNGVPNAPGALPRPHRLGPPAPVIGKICDDAGVEYWLHEDYSTTTTRWNEMVIGGKSEMRVMTDHAARMPDSSAVPLGDTGNPPAKKN